MSRRIPSRRRAALLTAGAALAVAAGAQGQPPGTPPPVVRPYPAATHLPAPRPIQPTEYTLTDLTRLTLERNPRIAFAAFAVDTAAGRALQAGLYPNPSLVVTGDELGDRQGPGGIWTAPQFTQEIVTGGKLKLSRAAALKEVDQATLGVLTERYNQLAAVRQGFFEVLAIQRRVGILTEIVRLAEQSVETTEKLLKGLQVSKLDVLQLQVEADRLKADLAATVREREAAFRRLAATVGVPDLPDVRLVGTLEAPVPEFDLDLVARRVLDVHPERRSAQVGVDRAQLLLRRAQVEPIPNVTVGAGYVRQNQNRSDDWVVSLSMPIPVWNKNQGNIRAAQAQVGEALQTVRRVESDLVNRTAVAFGRYRAARERAERYRTSILPRAREAYELSMAAYRGGQFEYLRVLQAQRAVIEATLTYNQALAEVWQGASELSGLTLEEVWPPQPPVLPPPNLGPPSDPPRHPAGADPKPGGGAGPPP